MRELGAALKRLLGAGNVIPLIARVANQDPAITRTAQPALIKPVQTGAFGLGVFGFGIIRLAKLFVELAVAGIGRGRLQRRNGLVIFPGLTPQIDHQLQVFLVALNPARIHLALENLGAAIGHFVIAVILDQADDVAFRIEHAVEVHDLVDLERLLAAVAVGQHRDPAVPEILVVRPAVQHLTQNVSLLLGHVQLRVDEVQQVEMLALFRVGDLERLLRVRQRLAELVVLRIGRSQQDQDVFLGRVVLQPALQNLRAFLHPALDDQKLADIDLQAGRRVRFQHAGIDRGLPVIDRALRLFGLVIGLAAHLQDHRTLIVRRLPVHGAVQLVDRFLGIFVLQVFLSLQNDLANIAGEGAFLALFFLVILDKGVRGRGGAKGQHADGHQTANAQQTPVAAEGSHKS